MGQIQFPQSEATPPWFVCRVRSGCERGVEAGLGEAGLGVYLPRETLMGRDRRGQRVRILRPLMPGYLFVAVDFPRQSFRPVLETDGVLDLLGTGGPRAVRPGAVEAMRAAEADGAFSRAPTPPTPLHKGDTVRLKAGEFVGRLARVLRAPRNERVSLVLACTGWAITASRDDVEAA